MLRFAVLFSLFVSLGASAAEPSSTETSSIDIEFRPLKSVSEGAPFLVDDGGKWLLGLGSLALVGARDLDEEMQEHFRHKERLGNFDSLGNEFFGTGVPGLVLGGALWAYGANSNHPRSVHAGQASIEAIVSTSVVVSTMKLAGNRLRPDASDRYSFPSGHTSTVFASAGVLHEFYGWKIGLLAESIGILTGLSRVEANRHWFSDTVGGGLIGFSIGRAIAKAHRSRLGELDAVANQQSAFTVVPIVDSDLLGAAVTARF
ncbi:MAG: phosphatase PAP2 family protein [Bdellovibrionota bacterium]